MKPGQFNNIGHEGVKILRYLQANESATEQSIKESVAGRAWTDLKRIPKPVDNSFDLCRKLGMIQAHGRGASRAYALTDDGRKTLDFLDGAPNRVTAFHEPFDGLLRAEILSVAVPATAVFIKTAKSSLAPGVEFDKPTVEAITRIIHDVFDRVWNAKEVLAELQGLYDTVGEGKNGLRILGAFAWYAWSKHRTPFADKYPKLWAWLHHFTGVTVKVQDRTATIVWGGKPQHGVSAATYEYLPFEIVPAMEFLRDSKTPVTTAEFSKKFSRKLLNGLGAFLYVDVENKVVRLSKRGEDYLRVRAERKAKAAKKPAPKGPTRITGPLTAARLGQVLRDIDGAGISKATIVRKYGPRAAKKLLDSGLIRMEGTAAVVTDAGRKVASVTAAVTAATDDTKLSEAVRAVVKHLKYNSYTKIEGVGPFTHIQIDSTGALRVIRLERTNGRENIAAYIKISGWDLYGKPNFTVTASLAPYMDTIALPASVTNGIRKVFTKEADASEHVTALTAFLKRSAKALTSAYDAAVAVREGKQEERTKNSGAGFRQLEHAAGTGLAPRNKPERRFLSNPKDR